MKLGRLSSAKSPAGLYHSDGFKSVLPATGQWWATSYLWPPARGGFGSRRATSITSSRRGKGFCSSLWTESCPPNLLIVCLCVSACLLACLLTRVYTTVYYSDHCAECVVATQRRRQQQQRKAKSPHKSFFLVYIYSTPHRQPIIWYNKIFPPLVLLSGRTQPFRSIMSCVPFLLKHSSWPRQYFYSLHQRGLGLLD